MPTGGAAGLPREASRNLTSSDGSENQPTLSRDGSGGGSGSGSGGGSGGKGSSSGVILRSLVKALPWALLLLFGVRGLLAMRSDGTTVDEPFHLAYGERALAAGTFLRENDLLNSKMPVSVLNAIPVAAANRGSSLSWRQKLFIARLPTLLLGVLLGALVWRWAHALFGPWSGVLALVLYSFCPNMLAHSHLVTTDVATGLGMFAATYCFWRYLTVPSRGRLLVAAAVFGAAQLTKATALFLVPMFALILLVRAVRDVRLRRQSSAIGWKEAVATLGRHAARGCAVLVVFGVVGILILNLGFWWEGTLTPLKRYSFVSANFKSLAGLPVVRDLPLPLPYAYLQGIDMVSGDATAETWSYLRGRYSQTGFRSYFLWGFLVKVPLATQVLLGLALWLWCSGRVRAPGAEEFLVVPVLFLLLYLSLCFRLDIGFRYFLPALPFLFVFASRVAAPRVLEAAEGGSVWRPLTAGVLLAWLAVSSFAIHPHYLAYFNEIAGGPAHGWRWLIDSNLDWGQEGEYVREVYAPRSPVPVRVLFDPSGPVAGRLAVNVTSLVGRDPAAARRHAWLRDNFKPIATFGYSSKVFDVTEAEIARCCAGLPRAWVIDRLADDLALSGEPFAGGDGVTTRFAERLNDGMLGANDPVDAARTLPPQPRPVRGWFGVRWSTPRTIGRVVAFPGFASRGPLVRKFLALDYVFQSWDGAQWRDIPGTRTTGNQALRVEHRFPPLRTSGIRLVVERERNGQGGEEATGGFRAACLELAAYPP